MTKFVLGAALLCAIAYSTAALADGTQITSQEQANQQTSVQQPPPQQATTSATAADADKQVICASTYHNGDVIHRPTCTTRNQRKFNSMLNRQQIREMQQNGLMSNQIPH